MKEHPRARHRALLIAIAAIACEPSNGVAPPTPRRMPSGATGSLSPAAAPTVEPPAPSNESVERPRLFAKSRFVLIRPAPDARKDWIGFLWTGAAVELKGAVARSGPGCKTFYAIEPRGYVCVDGENVTLDAHDPVYRALVPYAPKVDSPWLHRYARSLGLTRYRSTPTAELQNRQEPDLSAHSKKLERARSGDVAIELSGVDLSVPSHAGFEFPHLPGAVFENRRTLSQHSSFAYSTEANFGGRGFLLAADYTWVPKDRAKPYPIIDFRGVRLGIDASLPLAFFRKEGRVGYRRAASGAFSPSQDTFARLTYVELTGKFEHWRGQRYFEARAPSVWVREIDAVIPEPRTKTPWGARLGAEDAGTRAPKGRGTWIEVSIEGGWLVAVEGTRPVYATLISPGMGGLARPDDASRDASASPTGTYPISGKLVTATMVAPGDLIHADVPFVQNIVKPYALHGAYWHENWGNPQSAGCINLAPVDAKWLFDFSEPEVPKGWHAVRWLPNDGPATIVILHR